MGLAEALCRQLEPLAQGRETHAVLATLPVNQAIEGWSKGKPRGPSRASEVALRVHPQQELAGSFIVGEAALGMLSDDMHVLKLALDRIGCEYCV